MVFKCSCLICCFQVVSLVASIQTVDDMATFWKKSITLSAYLHLVEILGMPSHVELFTVTYRKHLRAEFSRSRSDIFTAAKLLTLISC